MKPETARSTLVFLLRMMGVFSVLAVVAVFMPHSWMDWCHQLIGMGELPDLPIVRYLTRSLSGLYFFFGAIVWYVSCDVDRYLAFIKFWTLGGFFYAVVSLFIDLTSGLPGWWTVSEAGFLFTFFSAVLLTLRFIKTS